MGTQTFSLQGGPRAVAAARAAIDDVAGERVAPDCLATLRLLVSEVVTNSVRHGSPEKPVHVAVDVNDDVIVTVTDEGESFVPTPGAMASDDSGGWGLYLVEQLADRWGVSRDSSTRVWFAVSP